MSRKSRIASSVPRTDRGADRGSVLIFVVGILLLLAIIATAFLGSSRSDRTATQQNAYNTQIDLLLDGVVNAMKGAIESDRQGNASANAFEATIGKTTLDGDRFLASRLPVPFDPTVPYNANTNPATWTAITGPLMNTAFSYPMQAASLRTLPGDTATIRVSSYSGRQAMVPGALSYRGQTIPAFKMSPTYETRLPTDLVVPPYGVPQVVPAMDADNDGIADSGMVELPTGPINGVTYYYGARIIDLNSAINVNTAWASNDPTPLTAPQYASLANFTPSNVDLQGLLRGNAAQQLAEMNLLNDYRSAGLGGFNLAPIDDSRQARPDFTFSGTPTTSTDALWMQLGRRPDNPGFGDVPTSTRYKAYDRTVSTALFSQFVIYNNSFSTALDTALAMSLKTGVPTRKYDPSAFNAWYAQNFDFPDGTAGPVAQTMPLRSLLTTTNTVADTLATPASATPPAWAINTNYLSGQVVTFALPGEKGTRTYVCINAHTSPNNQTANGAPGTPLGLQNWDLKSAGGNGDTRVDINTASFGALKDGFTRVLSATDPVAPQPYIKQPFTTATKARQFRNTIRDPSAIPQFPTPAATAAVMSPSEVLQMRAALAAVNTMDMRDADTNVTGRRITTINFTPGFAATPHDVTVFGSEPQPYITEVYVNGDPTPGVGGGPGNVNGYVAIELYNPFPFDLNLNGWTLGLIDRSTTPSPYARTITPILNPATYTSGHFTTADNIIVPANGYLILENFNGTGAGDPEDADHRPTEVGTFATVIRAEDYHAGGTANPPATNGQRVALVKYVSKLGKVLAGTTFSGAPSQGGELVLLRPRQWSPDGTTSAFTFSTSPEDTYDERVTAGNPNLVDLVPVDSFDFSGMAVLPATSPQFIAYHYARQNDLATGAWKWTHGGPYVAGPPGTIRQGLAVAFAAGTSPTFAAPAIGLGVEDLAPTWAGIDDFVGTQINPPASTTGALTLGPTPYRPTGGVDNKTPFGTFALQTDLLKVPFIGAYRVRTFGSTVPTEFLELNALPMDWSFADDQDVSPDELDLTPGNDDTPLFGANNNGVEPVGRFAPLSAIEPLGYKDWSDATVAETAKPTDTYDFSYDGTPASVRKRTIFNVFTTQSPALASLPNVSREQYVAAIASNAALVPSPVVTTNGSQMPTISYSSVKSGSGTAITAQDNLIPAGNGRDYIGCVIEVLTGAEQGKTALIVAPANGRILSLGSSLSVGPGDAFRILNSSNGSAGGTEGLVNINTAPWPVLARLPWSFTATGTVNHAISEQIAKRIVLYRDGDPAGATPAARTPHGPFRSILDLNAVLDAGETVPVVQTAASQSGTAWTGNLNMALDYGNIEGDLTPLGGTDSVLGDYETRFLVLGRVGNLITTRSDAFVVYINLQGWRDAGTAAATMVTQRRAALIVDRNGTVLSTTRIPAN